LPFVGALAFFGVFAAVGSLIGALIALASGTVDVVAFRFAAGLFFVLLVDCRAHLPPCPSRDCTLLLPLRSMMKKYFQPVLGQGVLDIVRALPV
jgi:hypothetical protein